MISSNVGGVIRKLLSPVSTIAGCPAPGQSCNQAHKVVTLHTAPPRPAPGADKDVRKLLPGAGAGVVITPH